jgi:hypothetical protein
MNPAQGEILELVGRLVDAIEVRDTFDPEVTHWDVSARIRDLERELAREWTTRRMADQVEKRPPILVR